MPPSKSGRGSPGTRLHDAQSRDISAAGASGSQFKGDLHRAQVVFAPCPPSKVSECAEADVQLTVWSVHGSTGPLTTKPDENGYFVFYLDLNPENEPLPDVGERFFYYTENCADCHYATRNELPLGPIRLELTATAPDGQQATAEREVTVDRSQLATIPIQVMIESGGEGSLDGIPIQAETRLYEWRGRRFLESTDDKGIVDLKVEALSQRETHYLLSVPPTLIDNRRYESVETLKVVVPPGVELLDPVTIRVAIENGTIAGSVTSTIDLGDADVEALAIALPKGQIYQETIQDDDTFSFYRLPLGEYLVTIAARGGAADEVFAQPLIVNLMESAATEVSLSLEQKKGSDLAGHLVDEAGRPIPFGWLAVGGGVKSEQVSPLDGRFVVSGVEDDQVTIDITAPGFWSQSALLSGGDEQEITLLSRSDRQEIEWGDGQVIVPSESVIVDSDGTLSLVRGWIWGNNEQPDPFTINMEGALIEVDAADFALEYAPGEVSWLYVNNGQVLFISREGTTTEIKAGEMMAFGDGVPSPSPVAAGETTVNLLRNGRKPTVALLFEAEPSTSKRLGDALASIGRNLSQGLVVVTYLLMFLMIIGAILFGARRLIQTRS